ncbi:glutaredoxin family protein [Spiribacter pallidus]|uniref:Glutaredoxin family protein n=1 Tax=Spiribacter pallidus TaxID=1987936 RepID=A0ABV3TCF1_9GAMM
MNAKASTTPSRSPRIRFYTTAGCHLCDEALAMLTPVARRRGLTIETIDVLDDPWAEHRYAESIPVVARDDRDEALCWPFDRGRLYRYLP